MSTVKTPRLQRTFEYVIQEAYAFDPEFVQPLTDDFNRMLTQDMPERKIVEALLATVPVMMAAENLRVIMKELGRTTGQPMH